MSARGPTGDAAVLCVWQRKAEWQKGGFYFRPGEDRHL